MSTLKKQVLSEFFASFFLGWLGLGAVVPLAVEGYTKDFFQFGWCFGIIIAFIVIIFNPISGAQFNPGVTLAMVVTGRQDKKALIPFILAQVAGWGIGTVLVYITFWDQLKGYYESGAGNPVNMFFCHYSNLWTASILEFVTCALLVMCILAMIDKRCFNRPTEALFPWAIALLIIFLVTFTAGYSGTCINMARDFGPRVAGFIYGLIMGYDVSGCFSDFQWVMYFIVPAVGAVAGAWFFDHVISAILPEAKE